MAKKNDIFIDDLNEKLDRLAATDVDADLVELTEEEKKELRAEAKAEVEADIKAEKRQAFKDSAKKQAKNNALFKNGKDEKGSDTELVLVQLASHTPFIALDGKRFYHGKAYRLTAGTAAVIKDQMYRGEVHDNEIHGKSMNDFYRAPKNQTIGPNTAVHF